MKSPKYYRTFSTAMYRLSRLLRSNNHKHSLILIYFHSSPQAYIPSLYTPSRSGSQQAPVSLRSVSLIFIYDAYKRIISTYILGVLIDQYTITLKICIGAQSFTAPLLHSQSSLRSVLIVYRRMITTICIRAQPLSPSSS